jgi:hypothetical protein
MYSKFHQNLNIQKIQKFKTQLLTDKTATIKLIETTAEILKKVISNIFINVSMVSQS